VVRSRFAESDVKDIQLIFLVLVSMVLSVISARAQQPGGALPEQVTLRGRVESVDHTARTVTIRGDRGNVVTLDVATSSVPFDQLQVNDVVSVAYYDRVSLRLKPAGEPAVDRTEPPVATSVPGALPGATVASQRVTTVTITGWDPGLRTVTFTGPGGTAYTRRLLDSTDASVMAGLKVGDRVDVTRIEAVRLDVESRTQAVSVAATSDFRNRWTISGLWGWDNGFSGKMIQESTGVTTTGVPINMQDVTYDDVYGTTGLFKAGAAYRTSPRSEVAMNFVYSKSAAQTVTVGSAGVGNVPLNVDFDDYSYWGIEGGQRWFLARTRFTPFAGYMAGANRYDDIRGTFVEVPLSVTPGLAAQDGKFFEKSWALNLGPTGGLLIGMGPIEILTEMQVRWTGGLSDVDWLVEEGLSEVNSDSSRWSFPVQIGARIRF
jgi:hypothetical protein